MGNLRCLNAVTLTGLLSLSWACSEAQFTGTSANRATRPTTIKSENAISCSLEPGEIAFGNKAQVVVSVKEVQATLYQTVLWSGEKRHEMTLAYGGPEIRGLYTTEDGAANEVVGEAEGTLTVELRKSADQEKPDASCMVTVRKSGELNEPVVPPTFPPTGPICEDSSRRIGAEIVFLIDNSNSNAVTDCPDDRFLETRDGVDLYECQAETNREAAVLAAYDLLKEIGESEAGNELAASRLAISSFPSASDPINGWQTQTQGFLNVAETDRDTIASAMAFTRQPAGMTPYGAALSGAAEVFQGAANDQRAKLAVLVTDGEPTDPSPSAVTAQAEALRAQGIDIITVFVTSGETRELRATKHNAMMKTIDDARLKQSNGAQHWYDSSYANFDEYITALLGGNGQQSLVHKVSAGKVVEVQDSAALKDTFLSIIKSQAIKCEP